MNSRLRMQVYRLTHQLHWISAAICFTALALFTITGITLNHASSIGAEPNVSTRSAQLPASLAPSLGVDATQEGVPAPVGEWLDTEFGIDASSASAEWSEEELYLS